MPAAGPQLTSNWPTPYSGSKVSSPTPASSRVATQRSANGAIRRTASSENGAAQPSASPAMVNSFSYAILSSSSVPSFESTSARARKHRVQHSQGVPSGSRLSHSTR